MTVRKRTTLLVAHVTATPPGWTGGIAGLRRMHLAKGWSDVGYNRVILENGRRVMGRGHDAIGAHVAGFNSIACGTAMVGGVNRSNVADFSTVRHLLPSLEAEMRDQLNRYPDAKLCGHRDLSPDRDGDGIIEPYEWLKECPTFDVIPWAQSLGLPVADIAGTWKKAAPLPGAPVVAFIGPDSRDAYLQRLLARAGFAFGPIDGIVGKKTTAAIKAYQKASGIPVSGAFDKVTVARLRTMFELKAAA